MFASDTEHLVLDHRVSLLNLCFGLVSFDSSVSNCSRILITLSEKLGASHNVVRIVPPFDTETFDQFLGIIVDIGIELKLKLGDYSSPFCTVSNRLLLKSIANRDNHNRYKIWPKSQLHMAALFRPDYSANFI